MINAGHTKSLDAIYANSAREMRQLQEQVRVLEDSVLDIIERQSRPTRDEIKKLQDFDLLWQTLGGLSIFFDNLREQVTQEDQMDIDQATNSVTLQKLRDRLRERKEMFEM